MNGPYHRRPYFPVRIRQVHWFSIMQPDYKYLIDKTIPASFMVRLTPEDPECPVDLLYKEKPGHRVSERHAGEGEPDITPGKNRGGQTEIPADYE